MSEIPYGFCRCGCGQRTNIAPNSSKPGRIKGEPYRFITGHRNYKGGKTLSRGRVIISLHEVGSHESVRVREHTLVAEKALGHPLPKSAVVHHVNKQPDDNQNLNLVICQDHAYHQLLHAREEALKACGHAAWRKCFFCKTYDAPENLYRNPAARNYYHRHCINAYHRGLKARRADNSPGQIG